MTTDTSFLQAALLGYQSRHAEILKAMADIERQLGGRASAPSEQTLRRKRRPLSAAARKRIAAAQRKRWAAYHEKQKVAN